MYLLRVLLILLLTTVSNRLFVLLYSASFAFHFSFKNFYLTFCPSRNVNFTINSIFEEGSRLGKLYKLEVVSKTFHFDRGQHENEKYGTNVDDLTWTVNHKTV